MEEELGLPATYPLGSADLGPPKKGLLWEERIH